LHLVRYGDNMAVMARETWTDERLDDLNAKVDRGFQEMRTELRDIRTEIGALNRTTIQFAFAVVGTIFLGFMGTIAALLTLAN
jgi:hypothetical protein